VVTGVLGASSEALGPIGVWLGGSMIMLFLTLLLGNYKISNVETWHANAVLYEWYARVLLRRFFSSADMSF